MRGRLVVALGLAVVGCAQEGVVGSLKDGAREGGATSSAAFTTISAGGSSTCVRSGVGDLRCWGENDTGSLGIANQDPTESRKPLEPSQVGLVSAVFSGESARCAIRPDGKIFCWGMLAVAFPNVGGMTAMTALPVISPFSVEGVTGAVSRIAVGRHFMCTLGDEGEVRCFGLNQEGQLGLGTREEQSLPTTVKGMDAPVVSLAASMGGLFACATTKSGAAFCWGNNASGQIGTNDGGSVLAPRLVEGLPGKAIDVVAGGAHACARLEGGKVACWGEGKDGQLGDGRRTASATPVAAEALTDVIALSAGKAHTCAVRSEGAVYCWGANGEGQAGSIPDGARPSPAVEATFGARAVSCGLAHTCAWAEGGRVRCWGSDARSQLGPREATF
ncbi:MAG: hypothetical protein JST00_11295 [Deltaproteobacteria bacterium]|nr:hypothetical protein [Deltaproteobacteria bacterium]